MKNGKQAEFSYLSASQGTIVTAAGKPQGSSSDTHNTANVFTSTGHKHYKRSAYLQKFNV